MKAFAVFPYPQQIAAGGPVLSGCVVDVGNVGTFTTLQEAQAILDTLNGDWEHPQPGKLVRPGCFVQGARYVNLFR